LGALIENVFRRAVCCPCLIAPNKCHTENNFESFMKALHIKYRQLKIIFTRYLEICFS